MYSAPIPIFLLRSFLYRALAHSRFPTSFPNLVRAYLFLLSLSDSFVDRARVHLAEIMLFISLALEHGVQSNKWKMRVFFADFFIMCAHATHLSVFIGRSFCVDVIWLQTQPAIHPSRTHTRAPHFCFYKNGEFETTDRNRNCHFTEFVRLNKTCGHNCILISHVKSRNMTNGLASRDLI